MTAKTDISKCLSLLIGKLKLCIFLSFIVLCLLQPTANYDLAIIEDYLAGNAKIKISIKKQNGVVVIFGEPWQLLLTGSAVPRIDKPVIMSKGYKRSQLQDPHKTSARVCGYSLGPIYKDGHQQGRSCPEAVSKILPL